MKKLIEKAQSNDLEAQPGRTIMESFENQVRCLACLPCLALFLQS